MSVAALTLQVLLLDHLARGLVLELVVLGEEEVKGSSRIQVLPRRGT